jgi:HlyD family secretion protein|tara:strand:- start:847 stop:2133 length:1287 start_codon:yes stop_codon:yes gene_type:complete
MAIKRSLQDITRKESSDAITSPDQLDQLMVVTRTRGWVTLVTIALILICGIIWSIFGSVSRNVTGMGMILHGEAPLLVQAKSSGQLVELGYQQGDAIKKGDVIASINDTVSQLQLADLQKEYAALEKVHADLNQKDQAQLKLLQANLERQLSNINESISGTEALILLQTEQLHAEQELLKEGLISNQQVIATQQTLTTLTNTKLDSEAQLKVAQLNHEVAVSGIQVQLDARSILILSKESSINELEAGIQQQHVILSPVDGTIMELRFDVSNMIETGDDVAEIMPFAKSKNKCVAYVDATFGKRIKKGMSVLVSPSVARPEKYGYIEGTVIEIGELIASQATIELAYSNKLFAEKIIRANPSPIKVIVALNEDEHTPSGYEWTSAGGFPYPVDIGTITTIKVQYETERPIELFLPWLNKVFLGEGRTK